MQKQLLERQLLSRQHRWQASKQSKPTAKCNHWLPYMFEWGQSRNDKSKRCNQPTNATYKRTTAQIGRVVNRACALSLLAKTPMRLNSIASIFSGVTL